MNIYIKNNEAHSRSHAEYVVRKPPARLYKYYSPSRSSFLNDRLVCFSTTSQLNDPFEGISPVASLFPTVGPNSMQHRVAQIDLKRDAFKSMFVIAQDRGYQLDEAVRFAQQVSGNEALLAWVQGELVKTSEDLVRRMPIGYQDFEREFAATIGIFCLSEDPLCAPMWTHYGAQYSGYLVEFNTRDPFFNGPGIQSLKPITYDQRSVESMYDLTEADILLRKHADWFYEKEWRTFRLLDEAKVVTDEGFHLFCVPPSAVSSIVLGENCSDALTTSAIDSASEHGWTLKGVWVDRKSKKMELVTIEV